MIDTAPSAKPPAPAICALTIARFRGITSLKWKPSRGVNVILGGGDVGKTTILEAIALLLSPVTQRHSPISTISVEISKQDSASRLFYPCRPPPE
jgi:predicted ATP-dependent endonuclease of OLD family